jgi:hypothetical protein
MFGICGFLPYYTNFVQEICYLKGKNYEINSILLKIKNYAACPKHAINFLVA